MQKECSTETELTLSNPSNRNYPRKYRKSVRRVLRSENIMQHENSTSFTFGAVLRNNFSFGSDSTDTRIKFNPPTDTEIIFKGAVSTSIATRHQCITAMTEYKNKSLEELREEDYTANKKASLAAARGIDFGATTQQKRPCDSSLAVSTSAFGFVNTQSKPLFGTTTSFGNFEGLSLTESSFSSSENHRPNRPISTTFQIPKILYQTKSTSTSEDNSEYLWLSKGYTTLSENFKCLYSSQRRTDVTIKVQNKEFHAHKLILSTRSDVFASMFEHDSSEEKSGVVDIPDCDPHSFEDFLLYLYTAKLDIVSSSNAVSLFKTADKYHLEELQEECIRCMIREIDVDSFCDIFHLAVMYNKSDLLSAVIAFFTSNASSILSTTEWFTLLKENAEMCNELLLKFAKCGQQK